MCGIAGYYGPARLSPERIEACLQAMGRRGPDHASHESWEEEDWSCYLLHSRLSIIDLDPRAHQPFRLGRHVLVTNGELYNYLELRSELEAEGVEFRTESDTEVLLEVLRRDDWKGLDRCEGMWAFACYDEESRRLLLGRDRFGEKPLCLYREGGGIYFASEPKFIFELLGRKLPVHLDQVYRYLVNGYRGLYKKPETFFGGLRDLPPASVCSITRSKGEQVHRYWEPRHAPDAAMTYEEAVAGAREALIRSVELRLRADVPLAFCQSGGIDSNSLISIAKNVLGREVHGFTIVNTDSRYEEQEMVDIAVGEQGLRHTAIPLEKDDLLPKLRTLVRYHDGPVHTITWYVEWILLGAVARDGYRISINGAAADEFFTGYYDHHNAYLYEVRGSPELHARSLANWKARIGPIVRNPFLQDPDVFVRNPEERGHLYLNSEQFSSCLKSGWAEPFQEVRFCDDLLRNRNLNEISHETVPSFLHEEDLNAMYHSIENRTPFLDRGLFEHCMRIPTRHLVQNGMTKAVLRDAMRGIVPQPILDNPRKVGFNAPILDLLDTTDPGVREYLLSESPVYEHVIRERIEALLGRDQLTNSESKFLFSFLNAKIFLEEYSS